MKRFLFRPPFIALGLLALAFLSTRLGRAPRWVPLALWPLGALVFAAGLALGGAALWTFHRAGTSHDPYAEPSALVTHGPFARTRNPMYLAVATALAGIAVAGGAWPYFLVPPAFLAAVARWFVPREERRLHEHYGVRYDAYTRRVPRWLFAPQSEREKSSTS